MGAHQSSASEPPAMCSLRTRNTEFLLVPLLPVYFPDRDFPGFQALCRVRDDNKIRYYYSRDEQDQCSDVGGRAAADSMFEFYVLRQARQLAEEPVDASCPIGCAVGIVVPQGSDAKHDAVFLGLRVRIIGRLACRNIDRTQPWEAGIFLHHQFTDGQLKFVAAAAAAMYILQSGGHSFRDLQFTTLQQNLSMLRALHTLRELVNGPLLHLSADTDGTPANMAFSTKNNRFLMYLSRDDVHRVAHRLAATVQLDAPVEGNVANPRLISLVMKQRLPVNESLLSLSSMLQDPTPDMHIRPVDDRAERDYVIFRVYLKRPLPVCATLDDAVFFLSRIGRMCDQYLSAAAAGEPVETAPVPDGEPTMYFGRTRKTSKRSSSE